MPTPFETKIAQIVQSCLQTGGSTTKSYTRQQQTKSATSSDLGQVTQSDPPGVESDSNPTGAYGICTGQTVGGPVTSLFMRNVYFLPGDPIVSINGFLP